MKKVCLFFAVAATGLLAADTVVIHTPGIIEGFLADIGIYIGGRPVVYAPPPPPPRPCPVVVTPPPPPRPLRPAPHHAPPPRPLRPAPHHAPPHHGGGHGRR